MRKELIDTWAHVQVLLLPNQIPDLSWLGITDDFHSWGLCHVTAVLWPRFRLSPRCLVHGFLENAEAGRGMDSPSRSSCSFYPTERRVLYSLIASFVALLARLPHWDVSAIDLILFHVNLALRGDVRHVSVWMGEGGVRGRERRKGVVEPYMSAWKAAWVVQLHHAIVVIVKKGRTKDSPCYGSVTPLLGKLSCWY